MSNPGYVYFLAERGGPYIKVGRSKRVIKARLSQIQSYNPREIYVLYEGYSQEHDFHEKTLHAIFEAERVQGEWFLNAGRVKEFLGLVQNLPFVDAINHLSEKYFVASNKGNHYSVRLDIDNRRRDAYIEAFN